MAQVFHKPVRFIFPEHVNPEDFWRFVQTHMTGTQHFVMKKNRELLVSLDPKAIMKVSGVDFIPCMLVSYRDASVVAQMQTNADGKRTVNVPETAMKVMDFNYILISKNNGMAVYQSYGNAASTQVLEDILRLVFNQYKLVPEQQDIDKLDPKFSKTRLEKETRLIRNKWREYPEVRIMCDSENELEKVLSEWSKINSFTYRLSAFSEPDLNWRPLKNLVSLATQKVTFVSTATPKEIVKAVLGIKGELKRGSFYGVDDTKAERAVDIFELTRNWATFEFDSLKVKLDGLVLEEFYNSSVFKWLQDTIEPRIAAFRDPLDDE